MYDFLPVLIFRFPFVFVFVFFLFFLFFEEGRYFVCSKYGYLCMSCFVLCFLASTFIFLTFLTSRFHSFTRRLASPSSD